jgi:hypothetical protein
MTQQITILRRMKGVILIFSVALLFGMGACSVAEQGATGVGQKFQDGIQGRGTIVPNHPTQDSFGPEYR